MAERLLETLQEATSAAEARKARESAAEAKRQKKAAAAKKRRIADEASEFAELHGQPEIDLLRSEAVSATKDGKHGLKRIWTVRRGEYAPEPTEELAKYRALQGKVAQYFKDEGLATKLVDHRDSYEKRVGRSDEGWWPTVEGDHLIGIEISWQPISDASQLRDSNWQPLAKPQSA